MKFHLDISDDDVRLLRIFAERENDERGREYDFFSKYSLHTSDLRRRTYSKILIQSLRKTCWTEGLMTSAFDM